MQRGGSHEGKACGAYWVLPASWPDRTLFRNNRGASTKYHAACSDLEFCKSQAIEDWPIFPIIRGPIFGFPL